MIRRRVRRRLLRRLVEGAVPLEERWFERPTLVLAPHPDDETLGCGGLVARLCDRGTPVSIAFMTDGAGSHTAVEPEDLARTRVREATEAASRLGVPARQLHFFAHPDGGLAHVEDAAAEDLARLVDVVEPAQMLLPHHLEPNADHRATFAVAQRVARERGASIDALLYPVWFWDQWPWTNPLSAPRGRLGRRSMVELAARGWLGFRAGRLLTRSLDVGGVLDRKRDALSAHESQMSPPNGNPEWTTLAEVAGGEWLDLLLQPYEIYAVATLGDDRHGGR